MRRPVQATHLRVEADLPANVGVLLSTSSAADSHEWEALAGGIFSHEVRSGLRGAADLNGDQVISSYALWLQGVGDWKNGAFGGVLSDITHISAEEWDSGFVELFIEIEVPEDNPLPIPYIELTIGDSADRLFSYLFPDYATLAARGDWQRLQIPLLAFVDSSGTTMHRTAPNQISYFRIGAKWPAGRAIYFDDIGARFSGLLIAFLCLLSVCRHVRTTRRLPFISNQLE